MTSTSGTVQRPTDWAVAGRCRGSVFKVTSTGPTRGIPSRSQFERIKRFLVNSLLMELKIIQMSTEDVGDPMGDLRSRYKCETDTE